MSEKKLSPYEVTTAYKSLLRELFEVVRLTPHAETLSPLIDLGLNDRSMAAWWWKKRQGDRQKYRAEVLTTAPPQPAPLGAIDPNLAADFNALEIEEESF